jgi:hypothetical protein
MDLQSGPFDIRSNLSAGKDLYQPTRLDRRENATFHG